MVFGELGPFCYLYHRFVESIPHSPVDGLSLDLGDVNCVSSRQPRKAGFGFRGNPSDKWARG